MIKRRMCSHCGLYLSSLKAKSLHGTSCRVTEGRTEKKVSVVCNGLSRDGVGFIGEAVTLASRGIKMLNFSVTYLLNDP